MTGPIGGTRIWTVGHSTRSLPELIQVLQAHRIEVLVDVRSFPVSTLHPQFNRENLAAKLLPIGITYHWWGKTLGGYRKQLRASSPHTALRSAGFRNYANYMETNEFGQGIRELLKLAEEKRVAYMCAERLWWRCHRSLISDYLAAILGIEVIHIHHEEKTEPHHLHTTLRLAEGRLVYDRGESRRLL